MFVMLLWHPLFQTVTTQHAKSCLQAASMERHCDLGATGGSCQPAAKPRHTFIGERQAFAPNGRRHGSHQGQVERAIRGTAGASAIRGARPIMGCSHYVVRPCGGRAPQKGWVCSSAKGPGGR